MLPTPVRRRALDYFSGVGGSGRRPVEFADPTGGAGVWVMVRVALENPSTFRFYGQGVGAGKGFFFYCGDSKVARDRARPAARVIS